MTVSLALRLPNGHVTGIDLWRHADQSGNTIAATASLSIHNVPKASGRRAAIAEAIRVLKPGGTLLIVDISKIAEYRKSLKALGIVPSSDLPVGWRMWWSGPWMSTRILAIQR